MKFLKKPLVIEANENGTFVWRDQGDLYVKTLEGEMLVSLGDFVIQGVADEIYPCKPEIFYQTYDAYGVPKVNMIGGQALKSYDENLQDLLTNENYEAVECRPALGR
ncbi:hypothetical protein D922_02237 [Enterococcus faecalis 06-MB-DW-09]|nr:hypothetical protein D922_02237 [Enterococcus faecalis 06-MB-DW-09]